MLILTVSNQTNSAFVFRYFEHIPSLKSNAKELTLRVSIKKNCYILIVRSVIFVIVGALILQL